MNAGAPIATLPSELFSAILDHVDLIDLQATSLAITRALPRSPIPGSYLFRSVSLRTRRQVVSLMRRLVFGGERGIEDASLVKKFGFVGWDVDADVLNNLLNHLPNLVALRINVGTTFTPEHLDDMIRMPRPLLKYLSLTFRPYVEKATYYQFLKGSYFDGFLELLGQWPALPDGHEGLVTLSIVQEPPPRHLNSLVTSTSFAQPMVFFSFKPIIVLACSSGVGKSIKQLRFRIPSRIYAHTELKGIMGTFVGLKHLVLDATGLCGHGEVRNGWNDVGKICASGGIERARVRERLVNQELRRRQPKTESGCATAKQHGPAKAPQKATNVTTRARRPQAFGSSRISIRDSPSQTILDNYDRRSAGASSSAPALLPSSGPDYTGIRVLPPSPSLRTLCVATASDEPQPTLASQAEWTEEFEAGWKEGIERLKEHWNRLTNFTRNSPTINLMIFRTDHSSRIDQDDAMMAGLVEASGGRFEETLHSDWEQPPIICFGSLSLTAREFSTVDSRSPSGVSLAHRDGCGHSLADSFW
ncbi:hypothetical protein FRB94_007813 [Tulasnella sp. JGI-2019a]|nr:hypothetical protein FRB94_007813 [Tulasnella sp. JGI-2019a]